MGNNSRKLGDSCCFRRKLCLVERVAWAGGRRKKKVVRHSDFSSSGSSAGTTELAHRRFSVGCSLHCTEVGRVYPPHFDPFDNDHCAAKLTEFAIPLQERRGFHRFSGWSPMLCSNSSVQLGARNALSRIVSTPTKDQR